MPIPRSGLLFAASLILATAAPAFAESGRYATDPDGFVWSQLGKEHLSLGHEDAVLPRTAAKAVGRAAAAFGSAYATDPDPNIYEQLSREHFSLSHTDAVLPRSAMGATNGGTHAAYPAATDPDVRIRSMIAREHNVF